MKPHERQPSDRDTRGRSRSSRVLIPALGMALVAMVAAACNSSAAAPTSTTTAAPKLYLQKSGTGDEVLPPVTVPSASTVTWTFNCQKSSSGGNFLLASTSHGEPPVTVTNQTGLGGGGHKPYSRSGTYSLGVTTACSWKVTVGSTPVGSARSTVPTTTPAKSTSTTTSAPASISTTKSAG